MKKALSVIVAICAVFFITAPAFSAASKVFLGDNVSFQVYIPFGFQVPSGINTDGEMVKTQEFKRGYWGQSGAWEDKIPGEKVRKGFYRFKVPKGVVSIALSGDYDSLQAMRTWTMTEIEPGEVGLFVEGVKEAKNVFRLPTDDKTASYYLLMPNPGMNVTLGGLLRGKNFIYMAGSLYGVIISDSRGYLQQYLTGQALKKNLNNIIIRDNDIVVLEYRGEYSNSKK